MNKTLTALLLSSLCGPDPDRDSTSLDTPAEDFSARLEQPLDGGRVLGGILPPNLARPFFRTERYGMMVLLALIFLLPLIGSQLGMNLNILGWILGPASDYLLHLVATLTGLKG